MTNPYQHGRPRKRLNPDLVAKLKLSYIRQSEVRVLGDPGNPVVSELIAQGRLYARRNRKSFRHRFELVGGVPHLVFKLTDKRQYTKTHERWRTSGPDE